MDAKEKHEQVVNYLNAALYTAGLFRMSDDKRQRVAEGILRNPNLVISLRAKDAPKEENTAASPPKKEAKDNFYQFSVTDVKDIDLNRIVREQYEMGNLVTLLMDGKDARALVVHNEFLAQFKEADQILVTGQYLCPEWGAGKYQVVYLGASFFIRHLSTSDQKVESARFVGQFDNNCQFPRGGSVSKIKAELAAARAFTRKITVKVHSL